MIELLKRIKQVYWRTPTRELIITFLITMIALNFIAMRNELTLFNVLFAVFMPLFGGLLGALLVVYGRDEP